MPQTETIRETLLNAAERRARTAGYHGFSFRDLAADVGIKSASVHYHFPTKADLAYELMERYRLRALDFLGEADGALSALDRLVQLFRLAAHDGEMCLCGALGAASTALPPPVQQSATGFSGALVNWLKSAPDHASALPMPPEAIVALLEGALLLSVTTQDPAFFELATAPLIPKDL
jgi:TetR/AcrR family transcriptional repressor of nem operon